MSNNDVCIMLKIPTIFLEMIICWTTDSSTFSVLPFFTYQLSVSCHLLKRHSNQCEIYREVTVYTSCTCVLNQSLFLNNHSWCQYPSYITNHSTHMGLCGISGNIVSISFIWYLVVLWVTTGLVTNGLWKVGRLSAD